VDPRQGKGGRRARQAPDQAAQGRAQLTEVQARREHGKLIGQLGKACHAEHSGQGAHEPAASALAALDAHAQAHGCTKGAGRARDIMHPAAECTGAGDSIAAAAQKMRDLGAGSLPICGGDDRLHGILTDRDIVVRCIAEGRDPVQARAGDLAQETLLWVEAAAGVGEVLHRMEDHRVKHLPVIENHRRVGIITEADPARNLDEHRLAEFAEKVYTTA
jgi:CBS domain-containing protein